MFVYTSWDRKRGTDDEGREGSLCGKMRNLLWTMHQTIPRWVRYPKEKGGGIGDRGSHYVANKIPFQQ